MLVVPSVLDAVTVHADGALCTRVATLSPDQGRLPTQVRILGLPLGLTPGSLRASILQGPPGLAVRDIRPSFDVQLPPELDMPAEHRALEEALEGLARVTSEAERVQREIEALQRLGPSFPKPKAGDDPRDASPTAVLTLGAFVDEELATLHTRKLELERQQRDALAEVELRRRRLQEGSSAVRGQRAVVYRAATLTLSETGAVEGTARLALEYAVKGAHWLPGYELRMPRSLDGGILRMRASVFQRTGEDWTGVKLALSTAELNRRADVPELKALRIGRRQPPPARSGWREPPPGLEELFSGYDAAANRSLPPPPPPPPAKPEVPAPREAPVLPEMDEGAPSMAAAPSMAFPEPMPKASKSSGRRPTGSFAVPQAAVPPPAPGAVPMRSMPRGGGGSFLEKKKRAPLRDTNVRREPDPEDDDVMEELADEAESLGGFGGARHQKEEADSPTELELGGDLLDYGSLELSAASEPGRRGKLHPPASSSQEWRVALTAVNLQVDISTLMIQVSQRTRNAGPPPPPPPWTVPPRQSTPHFDYRYDVEARTDVPSDGTWHTVSVFSAPVGLIAEYLCVPSLEPQVFRSVKVENRTPHALLAGPVDVTLGEEFLMTSPLPTLAPGATQRLGLGVEEAIKVSRNTRFDEASGGVFGGATVLTHRVSLEVANRLGRPVTVELRERVPVVPTGEKDIKVEEAEVKPAWRAPTPLPGETPVEGERAWRVTLQPGEKQGLDASWTIKIPSSKMLQGGNRRT
ncbi:DUF4139 domain-containing protein [Stigmatella aurantiaca]|nr:DUF4139 domain-containing protein [Stigmatella aurantiaca]EAU63154.1 conserved hypothetical protein [Stigmatella aurantiaca DW4/3-1]